MKKMPYKLISIRQKPIDKPEDLLDIPLPPKELYNPQQKQFTYVCPRCMNKILPKNQTCSNCKQTLNWENNITKLIKFKK